MNENKEKPSKRAMDIDLPQRRFGVLLWADFLAANTILWPSARSECFDWGP